MATENVSLWAVVQTGAHTIAGDVVLFVTADGKRCPAVLFTHTDYNAAFRRRERLLLIASRHRQLGPPGSSDMLVATPLLAVVPLMIEMPKKQPRKPVPAATPNGTPAPTVPTTPPVTATADHGKRLEKHKEAAKAA